MMLARVTEAQHFGLAESLCVTGMVTIWIRTLQTTGFGSEWQSAPQWQLRRAVGQLPTKFRFISH
jgi:hypothetical protein